MNVLQGVEDWVFDQEGLAAILSQDMFSLSGRWFDFRVDPDGVHIFEHGVLVVQTEFEDVDEAQKFLFDMCGVDDV